MLSINIFIILAVNFGAIKQKCRRKQLRKKQLRLIKEHREKQLALMAQQEQQSFVAAKLRMQDPIVTLAEVQNELSKTPLQAAKNDPSHLSVSDCSLLQIEEKQLISQNKPTVGGKLPGSLSNLQLSLSVYQSSCGDYESLSSPK